MNFEAAINAHTGWKLKLAQYLRNPDGSINAEELGKDDKCDLGRWILRNKQKYYHMPIFQDLIKEHADFHKEAAAIVLRIDKGADISIDVEMGASSAYNRHSSKIISLLMQLQTEQLQ